LIIAHLSRYVMLLVGAAALFILRVAMFMFTFLLRLFLGLRYGPGGAPGVWGRRGWFLCGVLSGGAGVPLAARAACGAGMFVLLG
jgi:hypothetical protein